MKTNHLFSDAIDLILLHSASSHSILNRKAITKEILFKYLHGNKVPVTTDFTKQLLIEKTIEFWKEKFDADSNYQNYNKPVEYPAPTDAQHAIEPNQSLSDYENFPINQMSRRFATWFFLNLNTMQLQETDFWRDCICSSQFLEQQVCLQTNEQMGAEACLAFCHSLRRQYDLFFNLNVAHSGTQGRIERHGLVLVLSCGTLHKVDQMVGTFECVFGLSRDPFSDNNWKINRINIRLHNAVQGNLMVQPTLEECESMGPLLALQMPTGGDAID